MVYVVCGAICLGHHVWVRGIWCKDVCISLDKHTYARQQDDTCVCAYVGILYTKFTPHLICPGFQSGSLGIWVLEILPALLAFVRSAVRDALGMAG